MRVLCICQYYYPEPFRLPDICEELVRCGHEVTVVTGLPNYPMGKIYEGYRKGEKRDEKVNDVKVHRCFTIGRKQGTVYRFLNYYSFAISSMLFINKVRDDFDIVFVNQLSPVMMAYAGIKYQKKHHKKLILYCLDLWPESLIAGGIGRKSFIYRIFHRISSKIYHQADKILVTSMSFKKYFEEEFSIVNTDYLPQYAETIFTPILCKKEPNEYTDLMFAGNIGTAQSVDTIIRAAAACKDLAKLRWHIVGDGIEIEKCQALAEKLHAPVIFHGRKPLAEMPKYYSMADAMLVTMQKDPVLSLTLPGKVQTYMSAGKPIIGAIGGETSTIIMDADCGFCCGAEDVEGLARIAREFIASDRAKIQSENAVRYYEKKFSKKRFIEDLIYHLNNVK